MRPRSRRRWRHAAWLCLAALTVLVLAWGSRSRELSGTDAFYAVVSRQVADTGHWAPLMHGPAPYVLKPPLVFWLTALGMKAFGASSATASLWPRVFAGVSVLLTALLARRLAGRTAAFFAALFLLADGIFLAGANSLRMDTGVLVGSLLAALAVVAPRGAWRPPLFWGGIALAVLVKGPVGLLPLAFAPLYLGGSDRWRRPWGRAATRWIAWSALLLLPVAWYAWLALHLGSWVGAALAADLDAESAPGLAAHVSTVFDTYVVEFARRSLPLAPLLVWGLGRAALDRSDPEGDPDGRRRRARRLLLGWMALVFLVLVVKETVKARYLILLLPPAAILGGREAARLCGGRIPRWAAVGLASLLAAGVVVQAAGPPHRTGEAPGDLPALRRAVDRAWPDRSRPVPLLAPAGMQSYGWGAVWPAMDWSRFYLERPIRTVPADSLAASGAAGGRYLVFLPEWYRDQPGIAWRVVRRSRHGALVELVRRRPASVDTLGTDPYDTSSSRSR